MEQGTAIHGAAAGCGTVVSPLTPMLPSPSPFNYLSLPSVTTFPSESVGDYGVGVVTNSTIARRMETGAGLPVNPPSRIHAAIVHVAEKR